MKPVFSNKPDLRTQMRLATSTVILASATLAHAQIPAFPGAEGYGAYATGGRGGDVYHVTNLDASGTGSFFDAIANVPAAGRTIVFDVSGYIRLPSGSDGTRITSSKITIAGQTAPGDGIGFYNNFLRISGDDVVLRHLRFRRGKTESSGDCIDLDSGSLNSMLDHLSVMFSTDENFSSFGSPPENLTFQYSLNSWGLEPHSCGGLWDQNHASSHHNLWSHNHTRNPKARPNGLLEWVNNVTFDWDIGFIMGDSGTPAGWKANVINNYFICPPGNTRSKALVKGTVDRNGAPNFTVHLSGNLTDNNGADTILNGTDKGYSIVEGTAYPPGTTGLTPGAAGYYQSPSAIAGSPAGITTDPALLAYKKIVSNAGALRLSHNFGGSLRDEVDTILINKLTSMSRGHVTRPSDTGASNDGFGTLNSTTPPIDSDKDGMPDSYETALGWNPSVQDHNTTVSGTAFFPTGYPAGYTRLEEYLHFKSVPHMVITKNTATNPDIDLSRYTSGFTNNPVFTISNITGGSVSQSGAGGKLVHFTANNTSGRGGFNFTVTDADGSVWTQQFAICIVGSNEASDLTWRGTGSTWDTSSSNWLEDGSPSAFSGGDRVTFDSTGAAAPTVSIPGSVLATTVDVNAANDYTFTGAGGISSIYALTKRGSGKLTINNSTANSFNGVSLEGGTLAINTAGGVGSAKITCAGGALSLGPASNSTISAPLEFLAPTTITPTSQHTESGNWTGSNQTVTLSGGSTLWTVAGNWSGFSGNLRFGNGSTRMRLNGNSNTNFGSTAVAIDLGSNNAQLMNRNGGTFDLGSLEATGANTALYGTQTGSTPTTYHIGALNTDTTFAGGIFDGGGGTGIVKTGMGRWTLAGASSHTGATTISQGALFVNGSLGASAVSVSGGATLGGNGSIAGAVTATNGSTLDPGPSPGETGTLTVAGGLSLNGGSTVDVDLSNSVSGANDKITVTGGNLALTSPVNFRIHMTDGVLQTGTYRFIDGSATQVGAGITMNVLGLPTDTRQTFSPWRQAAGSSPAYVELRITGDPPASLVWTGTNGGGLWDLKTTGNFSGGPTATFFNLDAVTFNDTSSVGSVVLSGTLEPRVVTVSNNTRAYTFSGTGEIGGDASLVKTGGGTLTLESANSYNGGTTIGPGSNIILANSAANTSGLGTGAVTFLGGTLTMAGFNGSNSISYDPMPNDLIVPTGQTGTLNLTQRAPKPGSANIFPAIYGSLSGGGTLNLVTKFVRGDVLGDWSPFTGTLNVVAGDGDGGDFRFGTSYSWPGMPSALVNLNANTTAFYVGTLAAGAGTTIEIGALSGTAGSRLLGGQTGGRALTYRIGGRGTNATFAGSFGEVAAGSTLTNFVKTGAGAWTLSGGGGWAGGTLVEQGTLEVSGTIECAGATYVSDGAVLKFSNGSFATDSVVVESGGSLNGYGTLAADLNAGGGLETRGFSSGTPGTLAVDGSVFFGEASLTRMRGGVSSDLLAVTGDMALGGTIQISLASGTTFGRYPLMTCQGEISGTAALTGIPGGTTAHLSTTVPGRVDLVIDDSDEDGLADTWENAYLGGLGSGPGDDYDGDGQTNAVEQRAGTLPNSGASMFAAEIQPATGGQFLLTWPSVPGNIYRIEAALSPGGAWSTVETVPAEDEPAASTSKAVAPSGGLRFYRVALDL
ncbi:MAG: autotransporter-associated beta strand repeat-containing protein [Akkermansiaceae bacterium]|nr:autotransporter-associated beta strand repeat-containing protein [Akkermansiaceae bacterium]